MVELSQAGAAVVVFEADGASSMILRRRSRKSQMRPRSRLSVSGVIASSPDGHIGVRLDGRIYSTFVSSSSAIACGPVGCVLAFSGSVLWQVEATVGLVIRF